MLVPPGRAHHYTRAIRQAGPQVGDDRLGRGEVDHGIEARQKRSRQRRGIAILLFAHHAHPMAALVCDVRHQAARLAAPKDQEEHRLYLTLSLRASTSKISGSGSPKNSSCSDRIASSASSSSIMKLMLISDAPCEIMRTFT